MLNFIALPSGVSAPHMRDIAPLLWVLAARCTITAYTSKRISTKKIDWTVFFAAENHFNTEAVTYRLPLIVIVAP